MLSKEAISQFQALYLTEFGVEITLEEAQRRTSKLLNLYRAVYVGNPKLNLKNKNSYEKKIRPKKTGN